MQGLKLSQKFYEEFGADMIKNIAPEFEDRIAVGIAGSGSECMGFDDEISRDHDFMAGFCLWLTEKDEEVAGFRLMRGYSKLPKEFMGIKKEAQSVFGAGKFGVQTIENFFIKTIGTENTPKTWQHWFSIPNHALFTATNGKVFRDDLGEFSRIRRELLENMPQDVYLKKLAAHLSLSAQAGQYNFGRCLSHGEIAASLLAKNEFVEHILYIIFALNRRYMPYYKWRFRSLRENLVEIDFANDLETLMLSSDEKISLNLIEKVSNTIVERLREQNLSTSNSDYLENHAFALMSQIKNREMAVLHIMDYGE